jgi:hypothetical protein
MATNAASPTTTAIACSFAASTPIQAQDILCQGAHRHISAVHPTTEWGEGL